MGNYADIGFSGPENRAQSGYSLIGVSLFLVVLGIMAAGAIGIKERYDVVDRQKITKENIAAVRAALDKFQGQYVRLPCPASMQDGPTTATFAKETDCAAAPVPGTYQDLGRGNEPIRFGAVPARTLGLPDSMIVDGYGHRLIYAVTEYYAMGEPDLRLNKGAIKIIANKATNTSITNNADGNVIYAVASPGEDPRGAFSYEGAMIEACNGEVNCSNNDKGTMLVSAMRQHISFSDVANSANQDTTATMSYAASMVAYEWRTKDWSKQCTCQKPEQTRVVGCYEVGAPDTAPPVNDKYCAAKAKPATKRSCADYCWNVEFPPCPGGCGSDVTIQGTLFCKENLKAKRVFGLCEHKPKPSTTKTCHRPPCPPPESTGGGYVDTDGDGKADTHIKDLPPGSGSFPSAGKIGDPVSSSTPSSIDKFGNYGGDVPSGSNGNNVSGWVRTDGEPNNGYVSGIGYNE